MTRLILALLVLLCASPAWAFPDNGVLDAFTGCTNNATPPTGNWTNAPLDGAATANVECQSAAAAGVGTATPGEAYYSAASYGANCEAYATIVSITAASFGSLYCNLADIGASTTDGYRVQWDDALNEVYISRNDNGTAIDLGAAISQTIAAGDKWGIRHVGDQICAWYKVGAGAWTQIGCRIDGTYTAGGFIGLAIKNTTDDTAIVDDFGGGTVTSIRQAVAPLILQ